MNTNIHPPPNDFGIKYDEKDFASYLSKSETEVFVLDLSKCTLLEVIDEMIKVKSRMSPNYLKSYSSLIYNLKKLQDSFKCVLMPHQITDLFWYNFVPFLMNKGLAVSSISTMCSQLKSALNWSARHKAKVSPTFDLIKIPPYHNQQVALTPDEVSHIYHFDISTIKRRPQHLRKLEQVRDMFVLSCNLGQRFSDMVRLDKTHFDRNFFSIMQRKTGVQAKVDIDKFCIDKDTTYAILSKYDYKPPLTTDISCYNHYLKELLQHIGFNDIIIRQTQINGFIKVEKVPKWKLITSHTARRTFITINVLKGFRSIDIRKATGHKCESSFEKYICCFDN